MFTLDEYKVTFRHRQYHPSVWCHGVTECFMYKNTTDKRVGWGIAICSRQDNFNKSIGRKIALARALKSFDKETRTRFWSKYHEVQGGVK